MSFFRIAKVADDLGVPFATFACPDNLLLVESMVFKWPLSRGFFTMARFTHALYEVSPYPQWRQRRDYAGWKRCHPGRSAQGLNSSVQQWHQNCGEISMNCFGTGADLTAHASAAFHALR
ncbi:hypothetical protein T03_5544 [Trichinella britovi]|uniref:Uncharacterized protein n=1 Tax=Trichinella britovi TaxID=45882 RepID=A0A0V1CL42_TRIBR|nr:hypothetical protein T03_5544 [Trichinella britovi]